MPRTLNSTVVTAINSAEVFPFIAIELFFDSGTLRFWTGVGEKTIGGDIYYGSGNLLGITSMMETNTISANGVKLTMSGIPSDILTAALSEPYQNRVCNVHFGTLSSTNVATMSEVFSGFIDQMSIEDDESLSVISLNVENKLIDLERPRSARYTSEYQKSLFPLDKGLEFVEDMQDKQIFWGRKSP